MIGYNSTAKLADLFLLVLVTGLIYNGKSFLEVTRQLHDSELIPSCTVFFFIKVFVKPRLSSFIIRVCMFSLFLFIFFAYS